jgi:hypothetical protein
MGEPADLKAQSAMEYLMTYGWAILIISIVLGSLFSLGVFSTSSFLGTACIPSAGYYCSITSYTHGTNVIASIGQSTGTAWTTFGYYFCSGCTLGSSGPSSYTYNIPLTTNSLASGGTATVMLGVPTTTSGSVGTVVTGSVWICWTSASYLVSASGPCTSTGNTVNFVQLATLSAKAT